VKYLTICFAIASLGHVGAVAQESATEAFTRSVSERTKAEAARPYRWIVEASKKPRQSIEATPFTERKAAPQRRVVERDAASEAQPSAVLPPLQAIPAASASPSQPSRSAPVLASGPAASTATAAVAPGASTPDGTSEASEPEILILDAPASDEPIFTVEPEVPPQILDNLLGAEVTATIKVQVEPNGSVSRASVLRASHPRVRQHLVEAIRQWRYPPAASVRQLEIHLRLAV